MAQIIEEHTTGVKVRNFNGSDITVYASGWFNLRNVLLNMRNELDRAITLVEEKAKLDR